MPICFISYSRESEPHRNWVGSLATRLQSHGVKMRFDQWDLYPGLDLLHFMETSVRESDFVLLVCTPTFALKANSGVGGVGYEKAIVTGELFHANQRPDKFVPILRSGEPAQALPSYLLSKVFVDFRDDAKFEASCEELSHHLLGLSRSLRPPLGAPLPFRPDTQHSTPPGNSTKVYCTRCGAIPGKASSCSGPYTSHNFSSGSADAYCVRCGATPGEASSCSSPYTSHNFVKH